MRRKEAHRDEDLSPPRRRRLDLRQLDQRYSRRQLALAHLRHAHLRQRERRPRPLDHAPDLPGTHDEMDDDRPTLQPAAVARELRDPRHGRSNDACAPAGGGRAGSGGEIDVGSPKCPRIRRTKSGSSIAARKRSRPPQRTQFKTSISNTRCSGSAHLTHLLLGRAPASATGSAAADPPAAGGGEAPPGEPGHRREPQRPRAGRSPRCARGTARASRLPVRSPAHERDAP